jgi:unsaturated rhamnogalacturonyl hydrolase
MTAATRYRGIAGGADPSPLVTGANTLGDHCGDHPCRSRSGENLPANDPRRNDYVQLLTTMAAALVPLQGADGIWRADLLNSNRFPNPEASGSGFFTFALAWGVHHGVLPRDTYLPVVRKAWNGLLTMVTADGRMQFVQSNNKEPAAAVQSDHQPYGAGAFLLAGSEVLEL